MYSWRRYLYRLYHIAVKRSIQRVMCLGWSDAEPVIIKLVAHSFIVGIAMMCLAVAIIEAWCLLHLGDLLFGKMEHYVKGAMVIGELLLLLYIVHFIHQKSSSSK